MTPLQTFDAIGQTQYGDAALFGFLLIGLSLLVLVTPILFRLAATSRRY